MNSHRIAIIGGGMTGLSLAYFLSRDDYQVTILEKGPALSGLVAFTHVGSVPIERFYHHFFTHDRYLLDLLAELDLADHIVWADGASAIVRGETLYPFVTKKDYLRLPFLSWPTKIRAGTAALRMRWEKPGHLPAGLTAEKYLQRRFGRQGWDILWRPLLVNKFGKEDARRISAQWMAKRIQIRAGSSRGGREVLGYIRGSYKVLADRLAEKIQERGGHIVLNCEVKDLRPDTAGRYHINGQEYDAVVSTIAPDLIARIVPGLSVPTVRYRGAICPIFVLRAPVTEYYWINNLDPTIPFSVIVNQQALLPAGYYGGLYPLYIGHYVSETSTLFTKSDADLAEYYLSFLRRIWPGIYEQVVSYEIGRAKHTQPIITAPWQPLAHTTNLPNLYLTSMAHIFPEDRGVNYSIREALQITRRLQASASGSLATAEKH